MPLGIYIHIPYCASKCRYCDFDSVTDSAGRQAYARTLEAEIRRCAGSGLRADSLFFGGGTPSVMEADLLVRLADCCREVFGLEGEITAEANPDSADWNWLKTLAEAGFTRISFGAQSTSERELRVLGRRHDSAATAEAMAAAGEAGFAHRNLDVMVGIPFQTAASLERTLSSFAAMGPDHISAYLLKIEEGTPFARERMERYCPEEEETAALYLQTVRMLEEAGFRQYEISNFAKPGGECRHNLKYWHCEEYLGFGPSAHSFLDGRRFFHPRGVEEYLRSEGRNLLEEGPGGDIGERLMLALRLTEGADVSFLPEGRKEEILRRAEKYQKAGMLETNGKNVRLTPEGFLVSNAILADLLQDL